MTTKATDESKTYEAGDRNALPVIASDILFEASAIGVVDASGHIRPLEATDRFVGFAERKADNSSGSAADINATLVKKGKIKLSVSGAVITDIGQPVYATDDNAFGFTPVSAVFIGFVYRFISSGVVMVDFDAFAYTSPYGDGPKETISVDKTLDVEDSGKTFFVDTDTKKVTLPATAVFIDVKIVNIGAFGTVLVAIDPDSADKIQGPDLPGTNNKDHLNTKNTARRGDFVALKNGHTDGAMVYAQKGIWATES